MSIRHVAKTVAISAATVACASTFAILAIAGVAGADAPSGAQYGQALPINPDPTSGQVPTAGTPFSSGQTIQVTVPANTQFNNHTSVNIVECNAPGGVLPTQPSACDQNTNQGPTLIPNADGSLSYNGYQVYALPDGLLGEGSSNATTCDLAHECVLYIGENQGDFTQPHYWSQAFQVAPNGTDLGTSPGDGTPEVPLAIGLPIAAAGIVGATVLFRRRRSTSHAS